MAITIHDLVILGTAVPEEISDGRKTVCVAAHHHDLGLIRLYPTRVGMGLRRWHKCTVTVERNRQDSRVESWKLVGSKEWELLQVDERGGKISAGDRSAIIDSYQALCPRDLDEERKSLAIIKSPEILTCGFMPNRTKPRAQPSLLVMESEAFANTKADYPFVPRITYACARGHEHEATVLEWGAYEWMRKNPDKIDGYWENVRIQDPAWSKHLLIGNQCHARTSWIVVGIIAIGDGGGRRAIAVQETLPL